MFFARIRFVESDFLKVTPVWTFWIIWWDLNQSDWRKFLTYDCQYGKREIVLKHSTSKVCYRKFSALFCHDIFDMMQHF